jgi:MerR family transcriptional regulator, heat shock protein HspR
MAKRAERGKAYYMISAVSQKYNIHPQTLRLYEREGLLKPSRTEGNTRLYSEEDLEQLETILTLTRDLGVNLAGVEIILNMRRKIEQMQGEVNEFMDYVGRPVCRPPWSSRRQPTSFATRHRKGKWPKQRTRNGNHRAERVRANAEFKMQNAATTNHLNSAF